MPDLTLTGVDYSFSRPSPRQLAKGGYRFAFRYLSHDPGKNITERELLSLSRAGVAVGLVWELGGERVLGGAQAGERDAREAKAQAAALGMSAEPIFFAVDFDVTPAQKLRMGEYFRAVEKVLGHERTGCYGGFYAVRYLVGKKLCRWFWQTAAWSGGRVHPRADFYQYRNGATVAGGQVDLNKGSVEGVRALGGEVSHTERQRRIWAAHLRRERVALAHTLAYRAKLRSEGQVATPAYVKSTWRMHAEKARIRKLRRLVGERSAFFGRRAATELRQVSNIGGPVQTNRIVILLSPVFVGLAGWGVEMAAKYLPGHPQLDKAELTAVFIAGASWAAIHVAQWIKGWHLFENEPAQLTRQMESKPKKG